MTADAATIAHYEHKAREILACQPMPNFFIDSEPSGHKNNVAGFDDLYLRPRVMIDVTRRALDTNVLGSRISLPVMIAPLGGQKRFHPRGELATAAASGAADTVMGLSTASSYSLEDVRGAGVGPMWFQLSILTNRSITEDLVRRAQACGYSALLLTVDSNSYPSLERDAFTVQQYLADSLANFVGYDYPDVPGPSTWHTSKATDFTWTEFAWLRSLTSMPIIVKGIQTGEDATLCVQHGADAVVVSNHGGAQSNPWAAPTIRTLPEVVDAVAGQLEVYLDGGVRQGADVLKALALGARAVLIGRPMAWGLTVDGEVGVRSVVEILRRELEIAMGLCGVTDLRTVTPQLVGSVTQYAGPSDIASHVARLAQLLDNGYLTRAEFDAAKTRLLHMA